MKHLTDDQYIKIIKENNIGGVYAEFVSIMRRWDEIRTDINPDATWYPFDIEEPKEEVPKEKEEYISRAAVVATLIEIAKDVYENDSTYEPIIEKVIEIESRIGNLPTIWIEKEVTANDDK